MARRHARLRAAWLAIMPQGDSLWLASAFSTVWVGITLHRNIFSAFHMKMYLEVYGLGASSLVLIHSVFAILNPANDLIGAAVSDACASANGSRLGLLAILFALWPFATVLPFWPFLPTRFGPTRAALIGLSVEDTIFSFAAIALGAIWTDSTRAESERIRMSRMQTVLVTLAGAATAGVSYSQWAESEGTVAAASEGADVGGSELGGGGNDPRMLHFAHYATAMGAAGGSLAMVGLGWLRYLERRRTLTARSRILSATESSIDELPEHTAAGGSRDGCCANVRELLGSFGATTLGHRNFGCFVVMSVLAEVQGTFNVEFSPILTDARLHGSRTVPGSS
jgi:hypothetical protein